VHHYFFDKSPNETSVSVGRLADIDVKMHVLSHTTFLWFIYATADEADAYMFYRCFFSVFFCFFHPSQKTRQPFLGTAERIFMKLSPNDTGENGVSNVMPPPGE